MRLSGHTTGTQVPRVLPYAACMGSHRHWLLGSLGLFVLGGCPSDTDAQPDCADTDCPGTDGGTVSPSTSSSTSATTEPGTSSQGATSDSTTSDSSESGGPVCGDGQCSADGEDCSSCPEDCGACEPFCGDATCDADEACDTCAEDCGACMPDCGNGVCDGGDHCSTCADDCGACADEAPAPTRGPYLQTGTTAGVTVRWRTEDASDSVVVYGPSENNLLYTARNDEETTEHEVLIDNLQPDSRYLYRIGSANSDTLGDTTYAFDTLPTPGDDSEPVRVWLLGDAGEAGEDLDNVRDAYYAFSQDRDTDVWIMLGDNAYNDGTDDEYQEAVFDVYTEYLRSHVMWSTIGNHERVDEGGAYFDIFNLPVAGEAGGLPSGTESWYSFDVRDIHFVCLDSDISSESEMMATWMENDLTANERTWLIAFWHHPPYTKGSHDSDQEGTLIEMRENFVPILEAYGVDMVLTGHSHSYERSYLLHDHTGDSDSLEAANLIDDGDGREDGDGAYSKAVGDPGTVYIVAGSSSKTSGMEEDLHEAMFISLEELGSMVLDVEGNRLDATFLGENGEVRDEFTMLKR